MIALSITIYHYRLIRNVHSTHGCCIRFTELLRKQTLQYNTCHGPCTEPCTCSQSLPWLRINLATHQLSNCSSDDSPFFCFLRDESSFITSSYRTKQASRFSAVRERAILHHVTGNMIGAGHVHISRAKSGPRCTSAEGMAGTDLFLNCDTVFIRTLLISSLFDPAACLAWLIVLAIAIG